MKRILVAIGIFLVCVEGIFRLKAPPSPPFEIPHPKWNHSCLKIVHGHPTLAVLTKTSEGVRKTRVPVDAVSSLLQPDVLIMGDSGASERPQGTSLPWEIAKHAKVGTTFLIAACPSYSPLIYSAQLNDLVPYFRPKRVLLAFDESDFGDDSLRYRDLAVRDKKGRITAVRPSALVEEAMKRFLTTAESPSHFVRNLKGLYFRRLTLPRLFERGISLKDILEHSPRNFPEDAKAFTTTLQEIAEKLKEQNLLKQTLFTIHPHQNPAQTHVATLLNDFFSKRGLSFWDATHFIVASSKPSSLYLPDAMHFNEKGLALHGAYLAQALEKTVPPISDYSDRPL